MMPQMESEPNNALCVIYGMFAGWEARGGREEASNRTGSDWEERVSILREKPQTNVHLKRTYNMC